jgi:hypothetical protein
VGKMSEINKTGRTSLGYQMMVEDKLFEKIDENAKIGNFLMAYYLASLLSKFVNNKGVSFNLKILAEQFRQIGLSYC